MRLPHVTDLAGADAAAVGIPFDSATSYRPGTRFGPEAIRSASALLWELLALRAAAGA